MEVVETQTFRDFEHQSDIPFPYPPNNGNGETGWDFPEIEDSLTKTSESQSISTPTSVEGECGSPVTEDSNYSGNGRVSSAAVKVQKVYRSYRTRRMLADSAVVAEELWWLAIDYARLNHSTISFFNFAKPESAASRWNRVGLNASRVGKGLFKDSKAQKLAFQHWIEAIDPRHRYGHNLHIYYEEWCKDDASQPFFYWLDIGNGKGIDLKECPRSKLKQECIKYLGPQEREHYEYIIDEGKIVHQQSGRFLDTKDGSGKKKWIFVTSTSKKLYAGQKQKGRFHHSSFLAGGSTLAAGRLEVEDGSLKSISPYSGHYRPTEERLLSFLSFLKENGVNLDQVDVRKSNEEYEYENGKPSKEEVAVPISDIASETKENIEVSEPNITSPKTAATTNNYKRTFSGGLESPRADIPRKAILERINSKKVAKSYQLGHQLSMKWSTGTGPRIGCIADYPMELRVQALQMTNLSPRTPPTPTSYKNLLGGGLLSPTSANGNTVSRE